MQQRGRNFLEIAVAVMCMAGCASGSPQAPAPKQAGAAVRPPPEQSGTPLLVPQVVTLRGPAKLSSVSGACFIVRGEGGAPAQQGAVLQDGDVLDLGNAGENGSVSIRSGGKADLVLLRARGRFFKLQIRP